MTGISIIVPSYNCEDYIERSLSSIKFQTLHDFECLVIDDASTDSSLKIINQVVGEDPRFRVYSFSENKGVGFVRNFGIQHARSSVIGFVDSDDYVDSFFYEKLLTKKSDSKADIVFCDVVEEKNLQYRYVHVYGSSPEILGKDVFLRQVIEDTKVKSWLFNKVFSRNLFEGVNFEGKTLEDFALLPTLIQRSNFVAYLPFTGYHYEMREGSLSRLTSCFERFELVEKAEKRKKWVEEHTPFLKDESINCLVRFYNLFFTAAREDNNGKHFFFQEKHILFLRRNSGDLLFNKRISIKRKIFLTFLLVISLIKYHWKDR